MLPFLTPESILLAKKFLRSNLEDAWRETEKRFQVDKEVIVAILLVESRFGENIGRRRVIPTLASMALMDSPENLQNTYQILLGVDPELAYEVVEGNGKEAGSVGLSGAQILPPDYPQRKDGPLEVKGSYAGALGMPQFLPSSYKTYSLNSKSFEEWLSSKEAAVISIANYLKSNGWKKNLSVQRKRQVIWSYNHSEPYVDTILQIAQKIKPESHTPHGRKAESPRNNKNPCQFGSANRACAP